jgi:hypothetical protein
MLLPPELPTLQGGAALMTKILEFPTMPSVPEVELTGCDESLGLASEFIFSCVSALESGRSANFNARFESYVRHRAECEKCNEV